jgi:hypothetical protein
VNAGGSGQVGTGLVRPNQPLQDFPTNKPKNIQESADFAKAIATAFPALVTSVAQGVNESTRLANENSVALAKLRPNDVLNGAETKGGEKRFSARPGEADDTNLFGASAGWAGKDVSDGSPAGIPGGYENATVGGYGPAGANVYSPPPQPAAGGVWTPPLGAGADAGAGANEDTVKF